MANVLVLGAGGLIGQFVASDLMRRGMKVTAAARRLTAAQRNLFGDAARETPIAGLDVLRLKALIAESGADIVMNCIGVLQDQPGGDAVFLTIRTREAGSIELALPSARLDDALKQRLLEALNALTPVA